MRDAEKTISAVMAGLQRAEAPAGLERRVQDGLTRRLAERGTIGKPSAIFILGFRWVALGLGCAAVSLAVAMSLLRVNQPVATTGAGALERRSVPGTVEAVRSSVNRAAWSSESMRQRMRARSGRHADGSADAVPLRKAVPLELSSGGEGGEGNIVSFPAPPMPLTQQERLLLRIANHGGPEEIAMLDWSGRAAEDMEETAVFQEFFGRPESVEQAMQKDDQGASQ